MNATILEPKLGSGVYTVPDISRILQLPLAKVRFCLNEYWDKRVGQKFYGRNYSRQFEKTKAVEFNALIEFYVYFTLRGLGISAQRILKARESMAKELQTPYPFATNKLLAGGGRIWYDKDGLTIDADGTLQTNLTKIIESFCKKIDFNDQLLAQRLWPRGKESSIVVDPHHQFGVPTINGTNIDAQTIFEMHESGEKIQTISIIYEINEKQINDALNFFSQAA